MVREVSLHITGHERSLRLVGGDAEERLFNRITAQSGSYERGVVRLLARLIQPDAVVLDAGAHVGAIALTMAVLAPQGVVHALEAVPETADLLEHNVAVNDLHNVRVHRVALAATTGTTRMNSGEDDSAAARVESRGHLEVGALSLDDWVERERLDRLDLVKADIEGSELAFVRGGEDTLRRLRPTLVMEVNPASLRRVEGRGPRELHRLLTGLYPRLYWIGRGGAMLPIDTEDDFVARLRRFGIGDLVCTVHRPGPGGWRAAAGRMLELNQGRNTEHAVEATLRVRALAPVPERMQVGSRILLPLELVNLSGARLESRGPHPVAIAARWMNADGRVISDGPRMTLPGPLRHGGTRRVTVELVAPAPGEYRVMVSMLHEHLAWLDDLGPEAALRFPVRVEPAPRRPGYPFEHD